VGWQTPFVGCSAQVRDLGDSRVERQDVGGLEVLVDDSCSVELLEACLPVRAQYAGSRHGFSTGLNPLQESPSALWVTGFDLAVSVLRTGRQPTILRAFRLVAEGTLPDLKPVQFRGAVTIDPRQPILPQFVAQRIVVKADTSLPAEERKWLGDQLKTSANTMAFGMFAEMNPQTLHPGKRVKVGVTGAGQRFTTNTAHPEEPGEYWCPFIASYVTGAGRLLLAVAESRVVARGGSILAKDTDSLHIVATKTGRWVRCPGGTGGRIRALSRSDVHAVAAELQPLSPYDPSLQIPLLKIEELNQNPITTQWVQLWGLALAAKRYCLFERLSHSRLRMRKRSEIGLGQYLAPIPEAKPAEGDPYPEDRGWISDVWRHFVGRALGHGCQSAPPWFREPAVSQLAITSPADLEALARIDSPLINQPGHDVLGPFVFMSAAYLARGEVPPPGCDPQRFRLIAPFSSRPAERLALPWVDAYSGIQCGVTTRTITEPGLLVRLKTIGEVVREYERHPEAKSLGPDGRPCHAHTRGVLSPRPVIAEELLALGKDTHRFESVMTGSEMEWDDVQLAYRRPGDVRDDDFVRSFLAALRTDTEVTALGAKAGVGARTIYRMKGGTRVAARSWEAVLTTVELLKRTKSRLSYLSW